MIVKLATKGQLIIPKKIRQALGLKAGMLLNIELDNGEIVLQPLFNRVLADEAIHALSGMFAESDLLTELEAEHRREIERELRYE